MQRRTFIAISLSFIAGVPLIKWAMTSRKKEGAKANGLKVKEGPKVEDQKVLQFGDLYGKDIGAITAVLLPSALGREQTDLLARNFLAWLADQDPKAEMNYAFIRINRELLTRVVPGMKRKVIDVASYETQINKYRTLAGNKNLSDLNRNELKSLLDPFLIIPSTGPYKRYPTGENLLWDITVFYFTSSEALDHFYSRKIGKQTPRQLASVTDPPEEL